MAKTSSIKKVVNGEIADADDVNQIIENAGVEGGLIPYDTAEQKDTTGSQSMGAAANPWGSLFVNQESTLNEIDAVSHTVASSVAWKNLRRFLGLKDVPASYVGNAGKSVRVNTAENALEFSTPANSQFFAASGTFNVPSGISMVYVTMIGGGGGGAGGGTGNPNNGAGGSGGGSIIAHPVAVTPGGTVTVTVGAAGTGGTVPNGSGGSGGASSFGTLTTPGGNGGSPSAGAGGASVNVSPNSAGNTGGPRSINGSGSGHTGGGGGGSFFGVGGAGQTGGGVTGNPGDPGTGYGAGGGGGNQGGVTGGAGGAGTIGFVLVEF